MICEVFRKYNTFAKSFANVNFWFAKSFANTEKKFTFAKSFANLKFTFAKSFANQKFTFAKSYANLKFAFAKSFANVKFQKIHNVTKRAEWAEWQKFISKSLLSNFILQIPIALLDRWSNKAKRGRFKNSLERISRRCLFGFLPELLSAQPLVRRRLSPTKHKSVIFWASGNRNRSLCYRRTICIKRNCLLMTISLTKEIFGNKGDSQLN